MQTRQYLNRIDVDASSLKPDFATLSMLQERHLLSVPFENLDIHRGERIDLDVGRFFDKIVGRRRGGFCYELNGLFAALLKDLGFRLRLVSARVQKRDAAGFGPDFDHLALIVETAESNFLVDVGFGDFAAAPLRFVAGVEQPDPKGVFAIERRGSDSFEVVQITRNGRESCYLFDPRPRELSEFGKMCDFHQTSPESHFTRGRLCSLMTVDGRKTLTDRSLVVTKNGARTELPVADEGAFEDLLAAEFGIVLSRSQI